MAENNLKTESIKLHLDILRNLLNLSCKELAEILLDSEEEVEKMIKSQNDSISDKMLFKLYYLASTTRDDVKLTQMIRHSADCLKAETKYQISLRQEKK